MKPVTVQEVEAVEVEAAAEVESPAAEVEVAAEAAPAEDVVEQPKRRTRTRKTEVEG